MTTTQRSGPDIEELDVVTPLADVPGTPVKAGAKGAVLVKAPDGTLLVEFANDSGVLIAEAWMRPADLRRVWSAREGRYVNAGGGLETL